MGHNDDEDRPVDGTLAFLHIKGLLDGKALGKLLERGKAGEDLVATAVRLGMLDPAAQKEALAAPLTWEELLQVPLDPAVLKRFDLRELERAKVCPLHVVAGKAFVLTTDRTAEAEVRRVRSELRCRAARKITTSPEVFARFVTGAREGTLEAARDEVARAEANEPEHAASVLAAASPAGAQSETRDRSLPVWNLDTAGKGPPLVRFVAGLLGKAFEEGVSDIHLEPQADAVRVRLRSDGLLHDVTRVPDHLARALSNLVKINAHLRVDIDFQPQDGRLTVIHGGRERAMRVSVFPSQHGESIVLRVLGQGAEILSLEQRGMTGDLLTAFRRLLHQPSGILFVVGPTGSGKSSTLFSALAELNTPERKIVTLEDPVEYTLPNLVQSSVDPRRGYTLAQGLRSVLRHDPQVVLLGEVRDREAAEIAIEAALTGHLVLSTLHTIDAPRAITRLLDMGIDGYLIEEALLGVLAQRLTRTLCARCKRERTPTPAEVQALGLGRGRRLFDAAPEGCGECRGTGFRGRTGVFELLVATPTVHEALRRRASSDELRKAARRGGLRTMWEDGIDKVSRGITSATELERVLGLHMEGIDLVSATAGEQLGPVAAGLTWCSTRAAADIKHAIAQTMAKAGGAPASALRSAPEVAFDAAPAPAPRASAARGKAEPADAGPTAPAPRAQPEFPSAPEPAPPSGDGPPAGDTLEERLARAAWLRRAKRHDEALTCLEGPRGSPAQEARRSFERAVCLDRLRDAAGALEVFRALAGQGAPCLSRLARAVVAFHAEEDDLAALRFLDAALAEAPAPVAEVHAWRGVVLGHLGRTDEALAEAERAAALEPADPAHHERLAAVLVGAGRLEEAERAWVAAIEQGATGGEVHLERARTLAKLGRREDALWAFEAAQRLLPGDHLPQYERACVLKDLGRLEEAEDALQHAAALAPEPWYFRACLALVHAQLGWKDQAREELAEVRRARGGDPALAPLLARVQESIG